MKIIPEERQLEVKLAGSFPHDIRVFYTGCGGMVISAGDEAIMTDPYHTGQSFLKILTGISINTERTRRNMDQISREILPLKGIQGVLVAHSHFDHLMDLPWLLSKNLLADSLKITGGRSTGCIIKPFLQRGNSFLNADSICYRARQSQAASENWISISPRFRVMMIESSHAPHFGKVLLMEGNNCNQKSPLLRDPESKSSGFRWKEGNTFSFLIDILDNNQTPALRIFIQSSASDAPSGFPPAELLAQKKIDLAFLCVASAHHVPGYPQELIRFIQPQKIILIHWEDFFRNDFQENPRLIRMTKVSRLMADLQKVSGVEEANQLHQQVIMPAPLSTMRLVPGKASDAVPGKQ